MFPAANRALAESAARQSMESNQTQVIVLTLADFVGILQDKTKNNPALEANVRKIIAGTELAKFWKDTVYPNASNTPWVIPASQTVVDGVLISKTYLRWALRVSVATSQSIAQAIQSSFSRAIPGFATYFCG